jgi:putative transposase
LLGVSRQVYYRSKKSTIKRKELACQVIELVQEIRAKMPRIGTRKLYYLLENKLQNLGIGRDLLFRILRANHMLIKQRRSYHITTDSHHRFKKHKNLIENILIHRPEQILVSDITYIGIRKNPMYLSLVTDAYSKKIMGHNVSSSLNAEGAIQALKMALSKRVYKSEPLIHHSDRGLQYCCNDYQNVLKRNKIKCSMTESYDPYQNAVAERINGIIKQEFLEGIIIADIDLMKRLINQTISIYNNDRPHSSCEMKTPQMMHKQREIKVKTYKTKTAPSVDLMLSN